MDYRVKTATAKLKAAEGDGLGDFQFTGYASVFGNKDSYGDVVQPGAFAETLAAWKTSGEVIPCLYGHDFTNLQNNLGWVVDAKEDDHGLLVKVQLDPDEENARRAHRLLKGRRLGDMSFAYEVQEAAAEKSDDLGDYMSLRKLKLFEVSVVGIGANQEAEILAVKAAADALLSGAKAGRKLSAKTESAIRTARDALNELLADDNDDDSEKASGTGPANTARKAVEEPSRIPSVEALSALEAQLRMAVA
jgi:HK97 family phage prohead protease